jgi:hypothetical protein
MPMDAQDVIAKYLYETQFGVWHLSPHGHVPFEQAEHSSVGFYQDAYFKAHNHAAGITKALARAALGFKSVARMAGREDNW